MEDIMAANGKRAGKHVIFGNGPLGAATARSLAAAGREVRMVSRSGRAPADLARDLVGVGATGFSTAIADARDPEAVAAVTADASYIYHCINVPYQDWARDLGPIQRTLVDAAVGSGAVLAVVENLYMYARGVDVISERTPENPPTRKGLLRRDLHEQLVEAGRRRGLRWTAVRGSDYYGPGATNQSFFGTEFLLGPMLAGRPARAIGRPDVLHSFTYSEDFGRALVVAAEDPRAHGEAWIVPNAPAVTQQQLASLFFSLAGLPVRVRSISRAAIAMAGLFDPLVRELREMLYQKEERYVVDGSRFASSFAFAPTPLETGVRRTLAWYNAERDARA
jgi:nucleoside-diphosphate-sugar epimerase